MDALSEILETIRLRSAVYFRSDFSSPWGMEIPKGPYAQFHMIVRGQCIMKMNNQPSKKLFAGDIIVFPSGAKHWLADDEKSAKENGMEVVQSIWNGNPVFQGNNLATTIVCGHFEFDKESNHPFIKSLPEVIHITDMERKEFSWLDNISNLLVQEANSNKSGSNVVVNKLAEVLFIHVVRAFMLNNKEEMGFLSALKDEKISKSLKLIHSYPENGWTLEKLATEVGMSRTLFANRFRETVGETPLNYITDWRMLKAKELLKASNESIEIIAEKVGYTSGASFNRVFKKRAVVTPLKYRQSFHCRFKAI